MKVDKGHRRPAVLALVGASGTGKTTLLCALLPRLRAAGLRVGVVKHSHHEIEVDRPGKDSHRLRKAGAEETLLVSSSGWALMADTSGDRPELAEAVDRFSGALDLILVEGYRDADCLKLELVRPVLGRPPLYPEDPRVLAVATNGPLPVPTERPVLPLDDVEAIAAFLLERLAPDVSLPASGERAAESWVPERDAAPPRRESGLSTVASA